MEEKIYKKTVNNITMRAIHSFGELNADGGMFPMWLITVKDFGKVEITGNSIKVTKYNVEEDMSIDINLPKYNINKYVVEDDETTAEMVFEIVYGLITMVYNFTYTALR